MQMEEQAQLLLQALSHQEQHSQLLMPLLREGVAEVEVEVEVEVILLCR